MFSNRKKLGFTLIYALSSAFASAQDSTREVRQTTQLPESTIRALDKTQAIKPASPVPAPDPTPTSTSPHASTLDVQPASSTNDKPQVSKPGTSSGTGSTGTSGMGAPAPSSGTPATDLPTKTSTAGTIELTAVAPRSDQSNYMSDKVTFQFDMSVTRIDMSVEPRVVTAACAPAGTRFRGIGAVMVDKSQTPSPVFRAYNVPKPATTLISGRCAVGVNLVREGDIVLIAPEDLKMLPPDRYGLTYGTLLVPYKYHFSGSDFGSGASVGGYLGYRWDRSGVIGIALHPVVFVGAATIPVSQVNNGQVKTENMAGISYGIGLLGSVKDEFQLGIIIGADRVNKSADYRYNGKVWLAISLGFEFSN